MKTTSTCKRTVRILATSIAAILGTCIADAQSTLFTYAFTDVNTGSGLTSIGGSANGLTFGSFTAVGTPSNPNAGGRFSFTGWSLGAIDGSNTFTGGINLSEYYEVTISPQAGISFDLDAISFVLQRSGTGIRQYSVRSSLDGFAANLAASITATDPDLSVVGAPEPNIFQVADASTTANSGSRITLSGGYDALINPITFRFYGWNAEATGGTFSIDDVAFIGQAASTATTLHWDTNGATAGIGGTGIWDTTTSNWNPAADGTGAPAAFTSASPIVFGGTKGIVTIDPAGVTASGGLQFDVHDYEIAGGALTLNATNTINTAHPAGTFTLVSAPIVGSNGLTKSGPGGLALAGTNSFTGNVMLSGGALLIASENALGAGTNGVSFAGGSLSVLENISLNAGRALSGLADLQIDAGKTLTVNGSASFATLKLTGAGTLALAGGTQSVGAVTFQEAGTLSSAGTITATNITSTQTTATATIAANLDLGAATRTVTVADGAANTDLAINGTIKLTGGSANRLHKLGAGTLLLNGDNSGTAGLTGSLRIGTAGATPAAGGTVVIANSKALGGDNTVQLQFNDGVLRASDEFVGANAIALGLSIGAGQGAPATFAGSSMEFTGPVNLFLAAAPASYQHKIRVENTTIFSGPFNASGSGGPASTGLSIDGAGTLVFNGASNAITEPIDVTGATLMVNGALSGVTSVLMQAGSMLTGDGEIAGATTFQAGSVLAPGLNLGSLDFGSALNLDSLVSTGSGTLHFELGPVGGSDQVNLTGIGALDIGTAQLTFTDFAFSESAGFGPGIYTLFSTNAIIDGSLGTNLSGSIGAFTATLGLADGSSDVILTVVPEPGCASLLLGGLACVAARRRRPSECPA